MRITSLIALVAFIFFTASGANAVEPKTGFVNSKVSSRSVSLNQAVRVEFITMPQQVTGIDIQATVKHALELAPIDEYWRLTAPPTVIEDAKTKTVTVVISLLPRSTGEFTLPQIPLSWLNGDQVADLGRVTVAATIQIGSETQALPKEMTGVSGFPWGCKFEEVASRLGDNVDKTSPERITAHPAKGLELVFCGGELTEASISAAGLDPKQARDSFINRWGIPQIDAPNGDSTWILGWTLITATAMPDDANGHAAGTLLHLVREDIQGRLNKVKVNGQVFELLDGKDPNAPVGTQEKKKVENGTEFTDQEVQRAASRPAIGYTTPK